MSDTKYCQGDIVGVVQQLRTGNEQHNTEDRPGWFSDDLQEIRACFIKHWLGKIKNSLIQFFKERWV